MSNYYYPTVTFKMEMEGFKAYLMHQLEAQRQGLGEAVSAQLDEIIAHFDFATLVQEEIEQVLPEMVRKALREAIQRVLWSPEVRSQFEALVASSVSEVLGQALKGDASQ